MFDTFLRLGRVHGNHKYCPFQAVVYTCHRDIRVAGYSTLALAESHMRMLAKRGRFKLSSSSCMWHWPNPLTTSEKGAVIIRDTWLKFRSIQPYNLVQANSESRRIGFFMALCFCLIYNLWAQLEHTYLVACICKYSSDKSLFTLVLEGSMDSDTSMALKAWVDNKRSPNEIMKIQITKLEENLAQ